MEIYRNRETTVKFNAPMRQGVTYSVTVTSPSGYSTYYEQAPATPTPGEYYVTINVATGLLEVPVEFAHTLYDGQIKFEIGMELDSGDYFSINEYVDVVTPLFTSDDLGSEYPAADVPELERLVRKVIESFTGQYFGRRIDSLRASERNGVINLNVPIIQFTGVSDRYMTLSTTLTPPKYAYEVIEDGFAIRVNKTAMDNYDIKTDSLWILNYNKCRSTCMYVNGVFGYDYVPEDVKQAALLIAGVWGCKQAVWRDRFIQTMRSSDWSVTYNEAGFGMTTGSVTADNLLVKYRRVFMPEVF